jgi:hypothetical protein
MRDLRQIQEASFSKVVVHTKSPHRVSGNLKKALAISPCV